MKITVFSDVHGNIDALEKLLAQEGDTDLFICLGDAVGYGPYNDECVDFLLDNKAVYLRGNHEDMFISGHADKNCSPIAKEFFTYSYARFTPSKVNLLATLPCEHIINGVHFTHTVGNRYIYPDTLLSEITEQGFYVIGHSHVAFESSNDRIRIVNVGSLGQNRAAKDMASYAIFDNNSLYLKTYMLDIERFIRDMRAFGYPESLLEYYAVGSR